MAPQLIMRRGGITVTVNANELDFFLRAGYVKVSEVPEKKIPVPVSGADVSDEEFLAEEDQEVPVPVDEDEPAPKAKTIKKKKSKIFSGGE